MYIFLGSVKNLLKIIIKNLLKFIKIYKKIIRIDKKLDCKIFLKTF